MLDYKTQYPESINEYNRALDMAADDDMLAAAYNNRSVANYYHGNYVNAIEDLLKALEYEKQALYCANLTESYLANRQIEEASGWMKKCLGDEFAADVDKELADDMDALKIIFDELEATGRLPEAAPLAARAEKLIATKNSRMAIKPLLAALLTYPGNANLSFRIAQCYLKTGNKRLAAKYFYRYGYLSPHGSKASKAIAEIRRLNDN